MQQLKTFRQAEYVAIFSVLFALFCTHVDASEAALTVRVFDKSTDTPISGVVAELNPGQVHTTNATGRLQFSDIEPGAYKLRLSCPGYKNAIIPSLVMALDAERSVIVTLERGSSARPQIINLSADQVMQMNEVVVSLLTLQDLAD